MLEDELARELPAGHLLEGKRVETFAWREGATDDTLYRHLDEPDRFTVIHLTMSGRTEVNAGVPTVEFDGDFEGFVEYEFEMYGTPAPNAESSTS